MSRRCWTPLGPACVRVGPHGPVASGRFTAIAVDPTDPTGATVYAGAATGGIWKTTDFGITWNTLGDGLPSLAIGALVVDPTPAGKFLFVGTGERRSPLAVPGVGVLISPDDGQSWDPLPPEPPVPPPPPPNAPQPPPPPPSIRGTRVNALVVDPTLVDEHGAHLRIWAATDLGLWFTEGRGRAWIRVELGDWTSLVLSDGQIVGARTGDGVFRNDETGLQRVLPADPVGRVVVAAAPSNPKILYAALTYTQAAILKEIWRSDDGGRSWNPRKLPTYGGPASAADNLFLAVHPADPNRVYLGAPGLLHTFDGGATADGWDAIQEGLTGQVSALSFASAPAYVTWAAASDGIYVSLTEGTRTPPVPEPEVEMEDESGDVVPPTGGPLDQEADWHNRHRGLAALQVSGIAQHPAERSILLGAVQDLGTVRYRAHPLWATPRAGKVLRVAIDANEPTTWYATADYRDGSGVRAVLQSKDAGTSWKVISKGLNPNDLAQETRFDELCPLAIDPSRKGILYFGTEKLYRWDDAHPDAGWVVVGETADAASNTAASPITAIAVAPSDPDTIYVGTRAGALFRMRNSQGVLKILTRVTGLTLLENLLPPFQILNGVTGFGRISSIAVHPTDPETVYVTTRVPTVIGKPDDPTTPQVAISVFASLTGGRSWRYIPLHLVPTLPNLQSPLPDYLIVNRILVEPNDPFRLFLATDQGVLVSADEPFPPRWRNLTDNLPHAPVSDLALFPPGPIDPQASPSPRRVVRAATFGRGVWERVLDEPDGPCDGVDLFVRDNLADTGEAPTPDAPRPDPLEAGKVLAPTDAADLRLDRPNKKGKFQKPLSNQRYVSRDDPAAVTDFIGFEALRSDDLQADIPAHVYLQVHNRGPSAARAQVRVLYAPANADETDPLPPDPFGSIEPSARWQPVGDTQEVDVRPGEPTVVRWTGWRIPRELVGRVSLAAAVSAEADPLVHVGMTDVPGFARGDKRVLLRHVPVMRPPADGRGSVPWLLILLAVGLAAYVVVDLLDVEYLDQLDLL